MPTDNVIKFLIVHFPCFDHRASTPALIYSRAVAGRYHSRLCRLPGKKVVVRLTNTGTHQGNFQGIPATGKQIRISSTTIYRLEGGKIVEEREDADWLGLMQQLGQEAIEE